MREAGAQENPFAIIRRQAHQAVARILRIVLAPHRAAAKTKSQQVRFMTFCASGLTFFNRAPASLAPQEQGVISLRSEKL